MLTLPEVSRSLAACGALLIVDLRKVLSAIGSKLTAIAQGLEVIPVLNKMDLPQPNLKR